jgi:hypothetical protein
MMKVATEVAMAFPAAGQKRSRDAWSEEEAWLLMGVAREREPAWAPVFLFYFQTGNRLGEGTGLRWNAVNLVDRAIHIRTAVSGGEEGLPKWGKDRMVPITAELHDHGVRPLSRHSFRHTWVSTMLGAGEDPQWVARCIGDSLEVIYKHYSHAIAKQRRGLTACDRPASLRYRLACDAPLASQALGLFLRRVFASLRRRAGLPAVGGRRSLRHVRAAFWGRAEPEPALPLPGPRRRLCVG